MPSAAFYRRISTALACLCSFVFVCSSAANAIPSGATGTIQKIELSYGTNYAFRIYLSNAGSNPLSSCSAGFAYMNTSDDNYEAKVASLLSARALQAQVGISYAVDASGFCQLFDLNF